MKIKNDKYYLLSSGGCLSTLNKKDEIKNTMSKHFFAL